jgi:hypothetical protein
MDTNLRPLARWLLWDHDRGGVAYDVAVIVVILTLLLVPGWFWGDPMWGLW